MKIVREMGMVFDVLGQGEILVTGEKKNMDKFRRHYRRGCEVRGEGGDIGKAEY